jgi:TolB-like protein
VGRGVYHDDEVKKNHETYRAKDSTSMKQTPFLLALFFLLPLFASQDAEDKIQLLCDSLAEQFPDSIATPRLAVIPFTDNTGKSQGQGVAELVVTCLQKSNRFSLVDRMEFQKALTEIELSQSDMVDSASALKVGKLVSAPYLLTGTIANIFGACKINAKIIRTETMQIYSTAMVTVAPASLDGLTKEVLGERGKISAALFRSLVAPGWGQFYTDHPVRGGVSLAAVLGAAGFTTYRFLQANNRYNEYSSYESFHFTKSWEDSITADTAISHKSWPQVLHEDTLRSEGNWKSYEEAYDYAMTALLATAGVYALNLLDAALAGAQSKKKFKLYFSGDGKRNFSMGIAYRF